MYKELYSHGKPDEFVERVFDIFDENKNGAIDFNEFVCALSVTSRGTLEEKLECTSRSASHLDLFI